MLDLAAFLKFDGRGPSVALTPAKGERLVTNIDDIDLTRTQMGDPGTSGDVVDQQSLSIDESWETKKLRLSINDKLINKNDYDASYITGFVNRHMTVMELLAHVSLGHAYCAEMKGNRASGNFVASDILSVDIDHGMTLDEAVEHPFVKAHGTFIYTTASHTEANHRFRIGFATARTVTDAAEMRAATRSLILRFSSDSSAVDPCRMFYGNTATEAIYLNGGIPNDVLDDLIAQSRGANQTDTEFERRASTRSWKILGDQVRNAKGIWVDLSSLKRGDSILCDFHNDRHPSAFIVRNRHGENGAHCHVCAQSFWRNGHNDPYDFYSFEAAARAISTIPVPAEEIEKFTEFKDPATAVALRAANIEFLDEEFLPHRELKPGATFIRSPKGTGKTEFLKSVINQNPTARVLLIGHRRSLIRSSCNRLGLDCYLTDESKPYVGSQARYGICLDSLLRIRIDRAYDYVVIDESEQVLAHFLSSTLGERRLPVLRRLLHIINKARHVVALDADLSWNTFRRICEWRDPANEHDANSVIINTVRKRKGQAITLVASKNQIIGEIHKAAREGKRCFVTSNSRTIIERLEQTLRKQDPDVSLIAITSTTAASAEPHIREFYNFPKEESTKYQIVLASPSLGTGVDFSFEREEDRFDIVFGIFEPLILSHFECDQQLARVRAPRKIRVHINPAQFRFETDLDTVTADALSFEMMGHLIKGYNPAGVVQYEDHRFNDPLLAIAASVLSVQRASKNDLKTAFYEYALRQGWHILAAPYDEDIRQVGRLAWALGSELSHEAVIAKLMAAPSMGDDLFEETQEATSRGDYLDESIRASFIRSILERFYRADLTPELIEYDNDGKFRKKVILFEKLTDQRHFELKRMAAGLAMEGPTSSPPQQREGGTETVTMAGLESMMSRIPSGDETSSNVKVADYLESAPTAELMIMSMLELTPFYSGGVFDADVEFQAADLDRFVSYCQEHSKAYETQFGKTIRVDLAEKPMMQLGNILKMIGLATVSAGTRTVNAKKAYCSHILQVSR
jgi:hypothetical protein